MKELTEQNFTNFINQDKLTLVDFWASWCQPCKMISPILDEISQEIDSSITEIGKLNVDEQRNVVIQYGIRSIPTIIFFKNGTIVDRVVGVQPKSVFLNKVQSNTKS